MREVVGRRRDAHADVDDPGARRAREARAPVLAERLPRPGPELRDGERAPGAGRRDVGARGLEPAGPGCVVATKAALSAAPRVEEAHLEHGRSAESMAPVRRYVVV